MQVIKLLSCLSYNLGQRGLTTDAGSPHHGIKKPSPHLKEIRGVLMAAVAQQIKFTGVIGRVGQAGLTPFLAYR